MLKEIKIKIPKDNGGFEEYEVCERWNDLPTHSYFYDEKCEGCKHIITIGYGKKKFCGRGYPWNYFKFVNRCVMFPSQNGLSYSTISPGFAKAIYRQMKELGWL